MHLSSYPLDHNDILAQVANQTEGIIIIDNDRIYPESAIRRAEDFFNKQITSKYNHKEFARIFIPIIHRSLSLEELLKLSDKDIPDASYSTGDDLVMGVIEVGYKLNLLNKIFNILELRLPLISNSKYNVIKKLEYDKIRLKLYIDNFAQPYYRAYLREARKDYEKMIENSEEKFEDSFEFIEDVLNKIGNKVQADYGNVSFKSFNSEEINFQERPIFYGFDLKENIREFAKKNIDRKGKQGIVKLVAETSDPYYSGQHKNNEKYIKIFDSINSELALPIKDEMNFVHGVVNFSSNKSNYFNKVHAFVLNKAIDRATDIFLRKKQDNTLRELVKPYNIFSQSKNEIYDNAVKSLYQYFDTKFICVWEKVPQKDYHYTISEATPLKFRKYFVDFDFESSTIKENDFNSDTKDIIKIQHFDDYRNIGATIYKFCQANKFKSYVIISIVIDNKYQGFINVFSKRKIEPGEITQYSIKLLKSIAEKVALAIQSTNLITAVEKISQSLSDSEDIDPIQTIVDQAHDLLPAVDSVILFPIKSNDELKVKDGVYSVNSYTNDKNLERRANLANYVLENGSLWINDEKEYIKLAKLSTKQNLERATEDLFWFRHNLKSVAAIKLKYENNPMGVMFFNYQEKKNFDDDDSVKIINAFTNLATTALLNEDFISRLKNETENLKIINQGLDSEKNLLKMQTNELDAEKKQLEKQTFDLDNEKENLEIALSKINKEYEKVINDIEEILPRATRTSYFLILQGVNHDVKNYLLRVQAKLFNIGKFVKDDIRNEFDDLTIGIEQNIQNINNLLKLFDFREGIVQENININQTIEQIIAFQKNQNKLIKFIFEKERNLPDLICHKAEFSMIIYNLVNNAVQAIESKGKKHIGEIIINTILKKKDYEITVEDNGIGIDNKLLDKIFDFGYTSKKEGLGIGLYFVKKILQENFYGDIILKSTKKKTVFKIVIPRFLNYKA